MTGGEGGSETPGKGREKARRVASSSEDAPPSPEGGTSGTGNVVPDPIPPLPEVPPETSFSDKDDDSTFHPDRGLTRVELKVEDLPPVRRAREEDRRGMNRVELDDGGIDLPPLPE